MKPKIYCTLPIPKEVEAYLAEHCQIRKWESEQPITRQDILQEVGEIEGLLTAGLRINDELLDHAPHLKIVSNMSVGYNNFDLKAMKKRNIIGTHTPNVLNDTVADLTFGLMLATARRIAEWDTYLKNGKWERTKSDEPFFGLDVHHKTLGIIGMGRIGEVIAKRARFGFDMSVQYYNRNQKVDVEQKMGITYSDLDTLLATSDFIVLLTPLTNETYQLIGAREFKLMKETAIFVNVSRGKTVDEQALIQALQNEEIYGAGLDVFEQEPIQKDNPLLGMPNVVTVPHIGSATAQTRDAMAMRAAENLVAGLTGRGTWNQVPY